MPSSIPAGEREPHPSSVRWRRHRLAAFQLGVVVADQLLDVRQLKVQVRESAGHEQKKKKYDQYSVAPNTAQYNADAYRITLDL